MICTFCGHRDCGEDRYNILKDEISKLIDIGVDTFYNGGYGKFDMLALRAVKELKEKYAHIKSYIVLAYRDDDFIKKYNAIVKVCSAETFYPFESRVLPRYAIIKRNEWMVRESQYMIAHTHSHIGGSGLMLEYAERKKIIIIKI